MKLLVPLILVVSALACSKKSENETEIHRLELSSLGPKWQGLSVEVPQGTDLELFLGEAIIRKGDTFALAIELNEPDFAISKISAESVAKVFEGPITWIQDSPEAIEYFIKAPKVAETAYFFQQVISLDGKKIGCGTYSSSASPRELESHKQACLSIRKN